MALNIDSAGEHTGWSYTSFDYLQRRLAAAVGIDLKTMDGHGGTRTWDGLEDPLVPFLRQSCDGGRLSPQECLSVKQRIWEVTRNWPKEDQAWARSLATLMSHAALRGGSMIWR
jgi:hypothetical protein